MLSIIHVLSVLLMAPTDDLKPLMDAWSVVNESYKKALQATSLGRPMDSARLLTRFRDSWEDLRVRYELNPPMPLNKDVKWPSDLRAVSDWVNEAARLLRNNKLLEVHETLENVRQRWLTIRSRNAMETFGDQLTRFHEPMERTAMAVKVSSDTKLSEVQIGEIKTGLPELQRLLKPIVAAKSGGLSPEEAAERQKLIEALSGVVDQIASAAQNSDANSLLAAGRELKPIFAELYMRFG